MIIKNYSPIVASFLHQIIKGGWKISRVIDCCGQSHKLFDKSNAEAKKIAKHEVLSGDEASVVFLKPNGEGKNMKVVAWLILGNGADELVADCSLSSGKADKDFQISWDAFRKVWEGKKVPTIERDL